MLRRTCLKHLGTCLCAAAATRRAEPQSVPDPVPSLCQAAAKRGLLYGATPEFELSRTVPEYRDLFVRHAKLLAPILSWGSISKTTPGGYNFHWQWTLDYAREHQIQLTGAHLLWHLSTPKYFEALTDPKEARKLAVDHINFMCSRFAGQTWSWNVVNEALNPREGRPGGLRGSPLLTLLGDRFFDLAFETAHAADPDALLVYNDYAFELDTPEHEARRGALLALLDSFLQRKLPVGAIGLQTHMRLDQMKFSPSIYRNFLREIAARGVKILLTELDVLDIGAPSEIGPRDQAVADCYRRILDVALDEKAVAALITWGLSDRYTWLTPRYSPRFTRPDGLPTRPLPFDENFQPKAAYPAIMKSIG
jgi:endo-1,4-beta-xylanase